MVNQLVNIILLGTAFMIIIIAYQTTIMVSQSALEGVKNETGFQGSGYVSQAMLQISSGVANIFIPAAVSIIGPTISMLLGAVTYLLYVLSFMYPMTWSYYTASILNGIGSVFLWNGQGVYFAANSDDSTISRNSGIFLALLQVSLLPGNIYIYLTLKTDTIDRAMRYSLFSVLAVVVAVSLALFVLLIWRSCTEQRENSVIRNNETKKSSLARIVQTLKISGQLLKTRNMLLLLIIFAYLGLSPAFFVVVYSTCIGHYKKYGDSRKRLIGLHGIFLGIGEISGAAIFGFITKPKTPSQRALIVCIGFILQIIFCYLAFLNIPLDASFKETDTKPFADFNSTMSQVITFSGSLIIGLGDSSFNTQLMNILGTRYKDTAASAFALFRLFQAIAAATTLFYAGVFEIHWQLLIVVIFLFLAALAFLVVLFDDETNAVSTSSTAQQNIINKDALSGTATV